MGYGRYNLGRLELDFQKAFDKVPNISTRENSNGGGKRYNQLHRTTRRCPGKTSYMCICI